MATVSRETRDRLEALVSAHGLGSGAVDQLATVLTLVAEEPTSITTVRDPAAAVDVHVADSLDGLLVPALRTAATIADLGSGGGFPGLVLAIARPDATVTLVESVGKKTAFLAAAADAAGLSNVRVVRERAESWRDGIETQAAVTARALASLPVLAEYAAPLLKLGGALVAWKGRRDEREEAAGRGAAEILGLDLTAVERVPARPGADDRHLYVLQKVTATPAGFPRRAGVARRRPLG